MPIGEITSFLSSGPKPYSDLARSALVHVHDLPVESRRSLCELEELVHQQGAGLQAHARGKQQQDCEERSLR